MVGAFTDGLGACALYNGTNFAKTADTIVVAINYRLGAFGFMASASMQVDIILSVVLYISL